MNSPIRRKSSLATFEFISPNKGIPRNRTIRRLSPHCVAGNLSVESTLKLAAFQAGGSASTNYAIDSTGRSGLGVEETNRAWTTSSAANDNEAITFEIANNGGAPDWRMSDAAINTFLDQAVETCKYYGYKSVAYQEKPSNVTIGTDATEAWIKTWAPDSSMIITLHNWYKNKACPGPYFMRQLPWLVREMNKRLQDPNWTPEKFIGEGAVKPDTSPQTPAKTPPSNEGGVSYFIRINTTSLNVRKGPGTNYEVVKTLINDKNIYTIIEEANAPDGSKWGRFKSGIGWVSLKYTARP